MSSNIDSVGSYIEVNGNAALSNVINADSGYFDAEESPLLSTAFAKGLSFSARFYTSTTDTSSSSSTSTTSTSV